MFFLILNYVEFGVVVFVGLKIEVGLCILSFKVRVSKDECNILEFIYYNNYCLRIKYLFIWRKKIIWYFKNIFGFYLIFK